jgi:4-amino-4-deoxy-L-arabinose transferase-like glycosyltransferase
VVQHRGLVAVLVLGALLRAAASVAYWPALTFTDSWGYVSLAYRAVPVAFSDDRTSGYPLFIHLLTREGRDLGAVTIFQHLAGLAIGLLVYLLLLRVGVRRWIATVAAALVVLDGYLITIEQFIATETLFTLLLLAAIYLTLARTKSTWTLVAGGLLLGIAVTIRDLGLVALPVWLVYVLWTRRQLLPVAAAVAALASPLVAYAGVHAVKSDGFRLTGADGWWLYGRVGEIAFCRGVHVPAGTEPLCRDDRSRHPVNPDWYLWDPGSPAYRAFPHERPGYAPTSNAKLRSFALAVIRARPLSYLRLVGHDFLAYFAPTGFRYGERTLPKAGGVRPLLPTEEGVRQKYFPGYHLTIRTPARFLHAYTRWGHTWRPLLGLFALAGIAATLWPRRRGRPTADRRRAIALLLGTALAMLLGAVASFGFDLRLLLPAIPLLIAVGAIGLEDLGAMLAAAVRSERIRGRGVGGVQQSGEAVGSGLVRGR